MKVTYSYKGEQMAEVVSLKESFHARSVESLLSHTLALIHMDHDHYIPPQFSVVTFAK